MEDRLDPTHIMSDERGHCVQVIFSLAAKRMLPNKALQPTVPPPLRFGEPAAELGRWATPVK